MFVFLFSHSQGAGNGWSLESWDRNLGKKWIRVKVNDEGGWGTQEKDEWKIEKWVEDW